LTVSVAVNAGATAVGEAVCVGATGVGGDDGGTAVDGSDQDQAGSGTVGLGVPWLPGESAIVPSALT
jgi:hypothetical protein